MVLSGALDAGMRGMLTQSDLDLGAPPLELPDADAVTVPDALGSAFFGPAVALDHEQGRRRSLHPADAKITESLDPVVPTAVPGYTILEALGRGGMAEVHLAEKQGSLGVCIRCALKMILPSRVSDPRYRDRLLDEARILAQLRHPNIVSVLDVGEVGSGIFIAMEWVDGVDVAALLERLRSQGREMPLRHVLYVLKETLQGLHHAHTATGPDGAPLEVVHRDISPGNILCSRQGAVALTDFGVATGTPSLRVEPAGTLSGKVPYFAPELFQGTRPSVRSDLFALGVTLWEMLTVRPLFPRRLGPAEMRDVIGRFHPNQLLEDDLTLPEPLERILQRCMAPDPAQRYGAAVEFLEDVNDFVYESGLRLLSTDFERWLQKLLAPVEEQGRRRLLGAAKGPS